VPADHGVWLDDDQHVRPARPEPGEHEPEGAVTLAQARAARGAPEVGQLLAQGEVLDCEVRAGAEGGTQRSKEAEKQGTHRVIMHDGEICWLAPLSIIATVGKHTSRTTSWRTKSLLSRAVDRNHWSAQSLSVDFWTPILGIDVTRYARPQDRRGSQIAGSPPST
jgi:hypothetical protein